MINMPKMYNTNDTNVEVDIDNDDDHNHNIVSTTNKHDHLRKLEKTGKY